jgi:hypothetical protein
MNEPVAVVTVSLLVIMLALNIMGCGGKETGSSPALTAAPNLGPTSTNTLMSRYTATPGLQSTPIAVPTIMPTPTPVSSPVPLSTVVPTSILQSTYIPNVLFLQIIEPQDGSEIREGGGIINGKTIPGAVISVFVNDDIIVADVNDVGDFSTDVVYALGPNMIEVLASDQKGNSVYSRFVVIGIE